MPASFTLSVVAPDRLVAEETVTSVTAPGINGYFGVWANHEPTITALKAGAVEYTDSNNQYHTIVVGGGFAEVAGDKMTILADSADRLNEIDVEHARRELETAQRTLRGEDTGMTTDEATMAMDRAIARLRATKTTF